MFYSPRKNIDAFIESKNEEIKSLKQKILGSRVTYEDMETAKSRLATIKNSYVNLEKEDHLELKQVLKTSQLAVSDLIKKKNRLFEEFQSQQKQYQETTEIQAQLLNKKQKAQQFYKEVSELKEKLLDRTGKKRKQIQEIQQEITIAKKQLAMERDIGDELEVAKTQLKAKTSKVNKDLVDIAEENKKLRESVRKELEEITKLEHQSESDELRIENLQLKIEKQEKNYQNLQQKIDAAQTFMQRFSQDRLIYLKQCQTAQNIESLLKMCSQSHEKKQKQQKECQQEINELIKNIETALKKRQALSFEMKQKQENIRELKQKGTELKSLLNSIFHQDSSVLKLIADKKVYESEEPPTPKKVSPSSSPTADQLKHDMLDLMATSDNFFMTTH